MMQPPFIGKLRGTNVQPNSSIKILIMMVIQNKQSNREHDTYMHTMQHGKRALKQQRFSS